MEKGIFVSTIAGGEARMLTRQLAPKVRPKEKRVCVRDRVFGFPILQEQQREIVSLLLKSMMIEFEAVLWIGIVFGSE